MDSPSRGLLHAADAKRRFIAPFRAMLTPFVWSEPGPIPLAPAFILSAAVLAFKAPDSLTNPQFWAEDGPVFFMAQQNRALPMLFESYATYLHAIPRLVAWIASFAPTKYAPHIYCYAAWLTGAASLASLRHVKLGRAPFLVTLSGVAVLPTNGEVFGTITNVQWILQFYYASLLARVATNDDSKPLLRCTLAALIGLTGPFSIFASLTAAILLVWTRIVARSGDRDATRSLVSPELIVLALAALVQLAYVLSWKLRPGATVAGAPHIELKTVIRALSLVQLHLLRIEVMPRWIFRVAVLALFLCSFGSMKSSAARLQFGALLLFAVLQLLGAVTRIVEAPLEMLRIWSYADRYYLFIKAVIFWSTAALVTNLLWARWARSMALAALVLIPAAWFWNDLARAPFQEMYWSDQIGRVRDKPMQVFIWPPGWSITVEPRR